MSEQAPEEPAEPGKRHGDPLMDTAQGRADEDSSRHGHPVPDEAQES